MEQNRIRIIDTMEHWQQAKAYLREHGYSIWQMQFGADCPEGFHIWFIRARELDIEIVTHNPDIQQEIVKYNG